jgi:hypothetical protein
VHVVEQFAEQQGRFGLEGRGGAQPYPGFLRWAGEAGVQLADQARDVAGGLVGEVGVAAEMVGDDLRGVLGADPSSTLLRWSEGGGEPGGGDGLAAQGAGAEDEGEHEPQFAPTAARSSRLHQDLLPLSQLADHRKLRLHGAEQLARQHRQARNGRGQPGARGHPSEITWHDPGGARHRHLAG